MEQNDKIYMTAKELAGLLGISVGQAYKMIRQMNTELAQKGFLVIAGRFRAATLRRAGTVSAHKEDT